MYTILVIGAGQLGSRHVQAILKTTLDVRLIIVDPSDESLRITQERVSEIETHVHDICYFNHITELKEPIDVAVIATNSNIRAEVTKDLIRTTTVSNIIFEKVLFQKISEYQEIEELLVKNRINGWVNCPRRLFSHYQKIKTMLSARTSVCMIFSGGNWGLGSNAIHIIDLFAFFTGAEISQINVSGLDQKIVESKRKGFYEITGGITVKSSNGSELHLISMGDGPADMVLEVLSSDFRAVVFEREQKMALSRADNNWKQIVESAPIEYQSNLTNIVIENILIHGECGLTMFGESAEFHIPFIEGVITHFNTVTGKNWDCCPIT